MTIKTRDAYKALAVSIVLASGAQLLFRHSMQALLAQQQFAFHGMGRSVAALITIPGLELMVGIAAYGLSMLSWILALTRLELSRAYPLLSISYVLVYIVAVTVPGLNERASLQGALGLLSIVLGVVLVACSGSRALQQDAATGMDKVPHSVD